MQLLRDVASDHESHKSMTKRLARHSLATHARTQPAKCRQRIVWMTLGYVGPYSVARRVRPAAYGTVGYCRQSYAARSSSANLRPASRLTATATRPQAAEQAPHRNQARGNRRRGSCTVVVRHRVRVEPSEQRPTPVIAGSVNLIFVPTVVTPPPTCVGAMSEVEPAEVAGVIAEYDRQPVDRLAEGDREIVARVQAIRERRTGQRRAARSNCRCMCSHRN